MITKKLVSLKQDLNTAVAMSAPSVELAGLSGLVWSELFENCVPTKEEFCKITFGLTVTPSTMWDMVIYIPKWQSRWDEIEAGASFNRFWKGNK